MKPSIYCIAGPPAMVKGLHEMLSKAAINHDGIRQASLRDHLGHIIDGGQPKAAIFDRQA